MGRARLGGSGITRCCTGGNKRDNISGFRNPSTNVDFFGIHHKDNRLRLRHKIARFWSVPLTLWDLLGRRILETRQTAGVGFLKILLLSWRAPTSTAWSKPPHPTSRIRPQGRWFAWEKADPRQVPSSPDDRHGEPLRAVSHGDTQNLYAIKKDV